MQRLSEGFVRVGADRVFFRSVGVGPPVVFVNGGSMDLRQWDDQLDDFSERYQVVRFDHRGWGRSTAPTEPYSPVADLAAVLDYLRLQRVFLVGSSFGGGVTLDFTLQHPERVNGLVLVAPALGGYPWSQAFIARHQALSSARVENGVDGHVRAILEDPHFVPTAADDPRLAARVDELLRANYALYATDFSLLESPERPAFTRLREIGTPTLVLIPEFDHPDVFEVGALIASSVEGCDLVELAGVGHMVHMERPDIFNRRVLAFIVAAAETE